MEINSEEQKIKEWHRRVDMERNKALKHEKYVACISSFVVIFFVLLVICVFGLLFREIFWIVQYL